MEYQARINHPNYVNLREVDYMSNTCVDAFITVFDTLIYDRVALQLFQIDTQCIGAIDCWISSEQHS